MIFYNSYFLQDKQSQQACLRRLKIAVEQATNDPNIVTKAKQNKGFDFIAHQDALAFFNELLSEQTCHFVDNLDFINNIHQNSGLYYHPQPIEQEQIDDLHVVHQAFIYMVLAIKPEQYQSINRILGFHNALSSNQELFKNKSLSLLIPFELVVMIHHNQLPKPEFIDIQNPVELYQEHPDVPLFYHSLTPSAVAGVAVEGRVEHTLPFIVHPNVLLQELIHKGLITSDALNDHKEEVLLDALSFDGTLGLYLLKNRYHLPIDEQYIQKSISFDEQLQQQARQGGAVVLEIHKNG